MDIKILAVFCILTFGCAQQPEKNENDGDDASVRFIEKIIDGDTIELAGGERVRLLGINAPERGHFLYETAKKSLTEIAHKKFARLETGYENTDSHGRFLRYVIIDGINISEKMVQDGLATTYFFLPGEKYGAQLHVAENSAREKKLGIWKTVDVYEKADLCSANCIGVKNIHYNPKGNDCDKGGEFALLLNACPFDCNMHSWEMKDLSASNIYRFKNFVLTKNSQVFVHSGCGKDDEKNLYWCKKSSACQAVWNNDFDRLFLVNSSGDMVALYEYG